MSDIFISYASEDRERAKTLAEALGVQGWTVWWDRTILPGTDFDEVIEHELDASRSVIVVWSEKSVASRWVKAEAREGLHQNKLIPVFLGEVKVPLVFRRVQGGDLSNWTGEPDSPAFGRLVDAVADKIGPPPAAEEKRKAEQEEQRQAEAEAKRKAEAEQQRIALEEARQKQEKRLAELKRQQDELRKEGEAEEQRLAEVERQEEEKRRKAEAEAKAQRKREEEERQRTEREKQRQAEEEKQRQTEAADKREAEEEERRRAETETKRKAEKEQRRRAEAEANREEEKKRRKVEVEARRADKYTNGAVTTFWNKWRWQLIGIIVVAVIGGAWIYQVERERRAVQAAVERQQAKAEAERKRQEQARLDEEEKHQAELERKQAEAEAERKKQEEIQRLLAAAKDASKKLRLTIPPGNNALEYFKSVLALDSGNTEATQGIERIVSHYLNLAGDAAKAGNYDKAETYLARAESIGVNTNDVRNARERIAKLKDETVKERLAALKRQEQARQEEEKRQEQARQEEEKRQAELARQAAEPKPLTVFRDTLKDGSKGPEMVVIPAGSFMMGSPETEQGRGSDEDSQRRVSVVEFAMGKYEVTFEEYDKFANVRGRGPPDDRGWPGRNRPVMNVSWEDAVAYAAWLSKETGKRYRLPTEAEWEYAARAETKTRYWWGNGVERNRANCDGCGSEWDGEQTAPVGSFKANAYGLYDTAGNVWEWVQDCWNDNYKGAPTDGSAWESGDCSRRVIRGGSWFSTRGWLRSADQDGYDPVNRNYDIGFRLAQDL